MEKENEPSAKKPRFASVSSPLIDKIVADSTPDQTKKATKFWLSLFDKYCTEKRYKINLAASSPEEIAAVLRQFYVEVWNTDGETYSRSSLNGLRAALLRHITETRKDNPVNIYRDAAFQAANRVFTANIKH